MGPFIMPGRWRLAEPGLQRQSVRAGGVHERVPASGLEHGVEHQRVHPLAGQVSAPTGSVRSGHRRSRLPRWRCTG